MVRRALRMDKQASLRVVAAQPFLHFHMRWQAAIAGREREGTDGEADADRAFADAFSRPASGRAGESQVSRRRFLQSPRLRALKELGLR